jgi:hypothetical protein
LISTSNYQIGTANYLSAGEAQEHLELIQGLRAPTQEQRELILGRCR